MRIYTRTGDQGQTSLIGGGRFSKGNLQVEAYGDVDELNSCLGLACSVLPPEAEAVRGMVENLQRNLFLVGARIATDRGSTRAQWEVDPAEIVALEQGIDQMEEQLSPLSSFILPGGHPAAAQLHVARTIARRAERACVRALEAIPCTTTDPTDPTTDLVVLAYLNRLSDFLFVLARYVNHLAGVAEVRLGRFDSRQRP